MKENSTRHSLLTKQKRFSDKPKIKSTGNKLTGWLNTSDNPIRIDEDGEAPAILREENDDVVELKDIPEASRAKKRKSTHGDNQDDDDALFVSSSDEELFATQRANSSKRQKRTEEPEAVLDESPADDDDADDKKKLRLDYLRADSVHYSVEKPVKHHCKGVAPHRDVKAPETPAGSNSGTQGWHYVAIVAQSLVNVPSVRKPLQRLNEGKKWRLRGSASHNRAVA